MGTLTALTIFLCILLQASQADETWWGRSDEYVLEDENLEPLMSSTGLMITFLKPAKVGCLGGPDFDISPLLGLTYRRWLSEKGLSLEVTLSHYKNSLVGGVVPGTSESMLRALPVSVKLLISGPIKSSLLFYDKQLYIGAGFVSLKANLDAAGPGVGYRISDSLDGHELVAGIAFVDDYRENMYRVECRYLSLRDEVPLAPEHVTAGGQAALDAIPPNRRLVVFDLSGPTLTLSFNHHF